jgi:hypothetical protein
MYSTSERVYITTLTMTLSERIELRNFEVDFPTSGLVLFFCQLSRQLHKILVIIPTAGKIEVPPTLP